jgi:hypothetical protein
MPPPTMSALLRGQLQLHMTTTPLFQGLGIEDISLHDGSSLHLPPTKISSLIQVLELLLEHRVSR